MELEVFKKMFEGNPSAFRQNGIIDPEDLQKKFTRVIELAISEENYEKAQDMKRIYEAFELVDQNKWEEAYELYGNK